MSESDRVFCAIYRWRLHPGSEQAFVQAWSRVTALLRSERGSLGSRLHRGPDDVWYSYTQWPSAQAKAEGLARPSVDVEAWQQLRSAIAESLPELILEPVADFLAPLPSAQTSGADASHAPFE
jgi:heme-degrading monooxygenase HmoA